MKACILATGSTGNCTYIETDKYKLLIDLGKNKKYIIEKLNEIGVNYRDIDYVFLTHTHDDHISALHTFLKGHKAKLFVTEKMFAELQDLTNLDNIVVYENNPEINGLDIKSYKMSHDVADIRSFVITENGRSLVHITDTGYINSRLFKEFKNKEVYFIESNHDIEMLRHGPYPEWLQRRVLSDEGHLSNKFAGIYLTKIIGDNTKNIVLIHLSEKNNTEEIALETVNEYLKDTAYKNINICVSKPNERSEVFNI